MDGVSNEAIGKNGEVLGHSSPITASVEPVIILMLAALAHDRGELGCEVADASEVAGVHGFGVDQGAADAKAAGAGSKEAFGGGQIHAARRHEPDLRKWPGERFDEGRAAAIGREDLHDVGARFPRRENLGRGECPGHDDLVITAAQADDLVVERGCDDVFRPGKNGGPGGFGVEHGARASAISAPSSWLTWRITSMAPGTVNVTSMAVTPPEARALAILTMGSPVWERTTATIPLSESAPAFGHGSSRRFLEQPDQVIGDDRLHQVMIEAGFPGKPEIFFLAISGDGDQGGVLDGFIPAQVGGQLISVHAGQADIEEHDVGLGAPGLFQPGRPVVCDPHVVTVDLKQPGQAAYQVDVVVDHENPGRAIAFRFEAASRRGSRRQPCGGGMFFESSRLPQSALGDAHAVLSAPVRREAGFPVKTHHTATKTVLSSDTLRHDSCDLLLLCDRFVTLSSEIVAWGPAMIRRRRGIMPLRFPLMREFPVGLPSLLTID